MSVWSIALSRLTSAASFWNGPNCSSPLMNFSIRTLSSVETPFLEFSDCGAMIYNFPSSSPLNSKIDSVETAMILSSEIKLTWKGIKNWNSSSVPTFPLMVYVFLISSVWQLEIMTASRNTKKFLLVFMAQKF